jgi:hypothetical protein
VKVFASSEPVSPYDIPISAERILKILGVPADAVEPYLAELITRLTKECREKATPCFSVGLSDNNILNTGESLQIGNEILLTDRIIASSLRKCDSIAIFIASCGDKPELFSKKLLQEGNSLEGYIVDIIASEMADGIAECLHRKLENSVAMDNLKVTNRFSPGYCKWPVNEQHKIFSLMAGNTSGVSLTASSLMIPIKSVSGIIGIGKDAEFKGYACAYCEMDHCIYRANKE